MDSVTKPPLNGAWRSLAWMGGMVATLAASAIAAVLAVFFTAALAVVAVMGVVAVGFAGLAVRARRTASASDSGLIEARRIGGNSWVAYGWDQGGRKA